MAKLPKLPKRPVKLGPKKPKSPKSKNPKVKPLDKLKSERLTSKQATRLKLAELKTQRFIAKQNRIANQSTAQAIGKSASDTVGSVAATSAYADVQESRATKQAQANAQAVNSWLSGGVKSPGQSQSGDTGSIQSSALGG